MDAPQVGDMIAKDGKVYMLVPFHNPQTGETGPLVWADTDLEGKYTVKRTETFTET